jgi:uncharacterized protein
MRIFHFAIFLTVFLAVYVSVNYYLYAWGIRLLPGGVRLRFWVTSLFIFLAVAFFAARLFERIGFFSLSNALHWIGSFWLGAIVYFFFAFLLFDLFRLLNHLLPGLAQAAGISPVWFKPLAGVSVLAFVSIMLVAGYFNALAVRVRTLDITVQKAVQGPKTLNLVMASDIHLGVIVGRYRLERLVQRINALKPDIILLAGDIVDEDLAPVIRENLGESLRALKAPLGVYGCTGNHEYIGGVEAAAGYLREHGITLLRDSTVLAGGQIYIAGREDAAIRAFAGKTRLPLEDLLSGIDRRYPIVLMDHQPLKLNRSVENGVDLQVSGHTHHGQMWPISWITSAIYELSYGYRRKGNTHIYVSSGAGTWGPPIRVWASPEIVHLRMHLE